MSIQKPIRLSGHAREQLIYRGTSEEEIIETTVTTKHDAEGIAIDYDAEGRIAGIEILDAIKPSTKIFGTPCFSFL